ncbi:hypothetical protein OROHE_005649 [Orobanche hederae]
MATTDMAKLESEGGRGQRRLLRSFHKLLMKNKFHPGKMDDTLSCIH